MAGLAAEKERLEQANAMQESQLKDQLSLKVEKEKAVFELDRQQDIWEKAHADKDQALQAQIAAGLEKEKALAAAVAEKERLEQEAAVRVSALEDKAAAVAQRQKDLSWFTQARRGVLGEKEKIRSLEDQLAAAKEQAHAASALAEEKAKWEQAAAEKDHEIKLLQDKLQASEGTNLQSGQDSSVVDSRDRRDTLHLPWFTHDPISMLTSPPDKTVVAEGPTADDTLSHLHVEQAVAQEKEKWEAEAQKKEQYFKAQLAAAQEQLAAAKEQAETASARAEEKEKWEQTAAEKEQALQAQLTTAEERAKSLQKQLSVAAKMELPGVLKAKVATKGAALQAMHGVAGSALGINAIASQHKERQLAAMKQEASRRDKAFDDQEAAAASTKQELALLEAEKAKLEEEATKALSKIFDPMKATETAEQIARLPLDERVKHFSSLLPAEQAQLLAHLGPNLQNQLLAGMPEDILLNIPLMVESKMTALARDREMWELAAREKDQALKAQIAAGLEREKALAAAVAEKEQLEQEAATKVSALEEQVAAATQKKKKLSWFAQTREIQWDEKKEIQAKRQQLAAVKEQAQALSALAEEKEKWEQAAAEKEQALQAQLVAAKEQDAQIAGLAAEKDAIEREAEENLSLMQGQLATAEEKAKSLQKQLSVAARMELPGVLKAKVATKGAALQAMHGVAGSALGINAIASQHKERQLAAMKQEASRRDKAFDDQEAAAASTKQELALLEAEKAKLEEEATKALSKIFDPMKATETAEQIARLPLDERVKHFSSLLPAEQAQLLAHLGPNLQNQLLAGMPEDILLNIPLMVESKMTALARDREMWELAAREKDQALKAQIAAGLEREKALAAAVAEKEQLEQEAATKVSALEEQVAAATQKKKKLSWFAQTREIQWDEKKEIQAKRQQLAAVKEQAQALSALAEEKEKWEQAAAEKEQALQAQLVAAKEQDAQIAGLAAEKDAIEREAEENLSLMQGQLTTAEEKAKSLQKQLLHCEVIAEVVAEQEPTTQTVVAKRVKKRIKPKANATVVPFPERVA